MMWMNSFGGNKVETELDSKDNDGGSKAKWTARTKSRQGVTLNLLEDRQLGEQERTYYYYIRS